MTDCSFGLREPLERLLEASFLRSALVSSAASKKDYSRLDEELDRIAATIDRASTMVLAVASAPETSSENRAVLYSLVSTLREIGTSPLSAQKKRIIYSHVRDTIGLLSITHDLRTLDLPQSLDAYLRRLPGIPREPRIPTGRLALLGDEIERRYRAGDLTARIAEDYGVSPQAIQQVLAKRGVSGADKRHAMDERIRTMALSGLPVTTIALEVGLAAQTIRSTLKRLDITPSRARPQKRIPEAKAAQIRAHRAQGATIREIAKLVDVSPSVVSLSLRRDKSEPKAP